MQPSNQMEFLRATGQRHAHSRLLEDATILAFFETLFDCSGDSPGFIFAVQ